MRIKIMPAGLFAAAVIAGVGPSVAVAQDAATNAMLRAKGEAYHRAPDSRQNPAEVAETRRLNAEVAARNTAAAEQEETERSTFLEAQVRHMSETEMSDEERARHEAAMQLSVEARARHEQEMADWRATVRACEMGDRVRCAAGRAPAMPTPDPS